VYEVGYIVTDEWGSVLETRRSNPLSCTMALGSTYPLDRNYYQKVFLVVKHSQWLGVITCHIWTSVSRQCGILDISPPCRPPWSLAGIWGISTRYFSLKYC
jgi:hypothetical protein